MSNETISPLPPPNFFPIYQTVGYAFDPPPFFPPRGRRLSLLPSFPPAPPSEGGVGALSPLSLLDCISRWFAIPVPAALRKPVLPRKGSPPAFFFFSSTSTKIPRRCFFPPLLSSCRQRLRTLIFFFPAYSWWLPPPILIKPFSFFSGTALPEMRVSRGEERFSLSYKGSAFPPSDSYPRTRLHPFLHKERAQRLPFCVSTSFLCCRGVRTPSPQGSSETRSLALFSWVNYAAFPTAPLLPLLMERVIAFTSSLPLSPAELITRYL